MTPKEFEKIAKTMARYGLTRVKIGDVEIDNISIAHLQKSKPKHVKTPVIIKDLEAIPGSLKEQEPIQHKVEQLASLMKLSDIELVDELFPDEHEQSA